MKNHHFYLNPSGGSHDRNSSSFKTVFIYHYSGLSYKVYNSQLAQKWYIIKVYCVKNSTIDLIKWIFLATLLFEENEILTCFSADTPISPLFFKGGKVQVWWTPTKLFGGHIGPTWILKKMSNKCFTYLGNVSQYFKWVSNLWLIIEMIF